MKPMMGKTMLCPFSQLLETGYYRFHAYCGVGGLAKEVKEELHILAIHADDPGTGQFRKFIQLAKKNYKSIYVWEVWNSTLERTLMRYEFHQVDRTETYKDGTTETNEGYHWEKTS